jgi:hypothetical protein
MRNSILACAVIGLWACGGSDGGSSAPSKQPATQAPSNGNGGSPPAKSDPPSDPPGGGEQDAGAPPPPPPADAAPACPNLDGSWSGKLQGDVTGQATGKVTGTATLVFKAGTAQNEYALQSGSQLDMNIDVGITTVPLTQAVAGSANCGVLDAAQDFQVLGKDVHATAKCTFTDSGCSGTWTAVASDGSGNGSGTFTVSKN